MRLKSFSTVSMLFLSIFVVMALNACSGIDDEVNIQYTDETLETSGSNCTGDLSLSESGKDEEALGTEDSVSSLDSSTEMNSIPESSPAPDKEVEEDASSIMKKYKSILRGESTFFSIVAEENIDLNQLNLAVAVDDSDVVNVSQFAVLDMDGDGTEELVLQLKVYAEDGYAFVILHHQDDVIYGYTIWGRGFRALKADGSFFFSSGAADNGWGTLQFDGKILTRIEQAVSRSYYDDDGNYFIEYFVDGTSVTEGDFTSALGRFGAKPAATWFDFTNDDLKAEEDSSFIMKKYKSILRGESTFFSIVAEDNIDLNQLYLAVTGDDSDIVNVSQFAVLDMDGDGTEELVLQISVYSDDGHAFVILHYQDDVIYGYTLWRREFMELKADGSFYFSGGAADTGWGVLQFDGKILTEIRKARSLSYYDENNNFFVEYFVDGTRVTEGDFTWSLGRFGAKPSATWFDFTNDNLDEILK